MGTGIMRTKGILAREFKPGYFLIQGTKPGERKVRRVVDVQPAAGRGKTKLVLSNGLNKPTSDLVVRDTQKLRTSA
jgi:hypothetical protein